MPCSFLFISLVLSNAGIPSGPVQEAWVRRYHGFGYGDDRPSATVVDSAGNVYVTGASFGWPHNYREYTTLKYDRDGNQLWLARYHYPLYAGDEPVALASDADGNVYVTGNFCVEARIKGTCTQTAYGTIKYNPLGQLLWAAQYHPTEGDDSAAAIAVDAEGNAYVTGSCCRRPYGTDYATVKYDSEGRQIWAVRYHGPSPSIDRATAISLDAQGNAYVTGGSADGADRNYATFKYDPDGNEVWTARYPGAGGIALALDVAGNVNVTGSIDNGIGGYLTIRYDPEGTEVWIATYEYGVARATALAADSEGNIYVTGQSAREFATVKYDSNGNEVWVTRYQGPGDSDWPRRIAVDSLDNVYVTGTSSGVFPRSDYATIKYDPEGNEVWVARYHGPVDYADGAWDLALDAERNVYVTGWSYFRNMYGGLDAEFATIKYSQ